MRKDFLGHFYGSTFRFITGIVLILPWIFIDQLVLKLPLFALLAMLTRLSGKKLKWGYFIMLIAAISFFHLLTPMGRALFHLGSFPVTWGSLEIGILKGLQLIGLVFISLFSVTPGLKFPGTLGGLLGRTLLYYQEILTGRDRLKSGKVIQGLDSIMEDLQAPLIEEGSLQRTGGIAVAITILLWLLFYGAGLYSLL